MYACQSALHHWNKRANQLLRRKDLLWLTVLELSGHDCLALLPLGLVWGQHIMGEHAWSQYSLLGHTPHCPNSVPLSPTSQEHRGLVTQLLVYEPLKDTQALNHNSVLSETHQSKLMTPFHRDEHQAWLQVKHVKTSLQLSGGRDYICLVH